MLKLYLPKCEIRAVCKDDIPTSKLCRSAQMKADKVCRSIILLWRLFHLYFNIQKTSHLTLRILFFLLLITTFFFLLAACLQKYIVLTVGVLPSKLYGERNAVNRMSIR